MKRRTVLFFVVALCLTLLVSIVEKTAHLEGLYSAYLGVWVAILVGMIAYNVLYAVWWNRKIRPTLKLLEEGRTEEFIAETQRLRQKARRKNVRNLLEYNLAVGYIQRSEYDKAAVILQNLSHSQLPNQIEIMRRLNLCICYFYTGCTEQATQLYQDSQSMFHTKQAERFRGNLDSLEILAAMETGEPDRAEELLKTARERWQTPPFRKAWDELAERLADKRKKDCCF